MAETLTLGWLIALVAERGIEELYRRVRARYHQEWLDLSEGAPATSGLILRPRVGPLVPPPYWLLLALARGDGWTMPVPALYGDTIKLRLARAQYQIQVLFLSKNAAMFVKPHLIAVGGTFQHVMSHRPARIELVGGRPSPDQLQELMSDAPPGGLPFILPAPAVRRIGLLPRRSFRAIEPPPPRRDEPSTEPADADACRCSAMNRYGARCGNAADGLDFCEAHLEMARDGKEVYWYDTGELVDDDDIDDADFDDEDDDIDEDDDGDFDDDEDDDIDEDDDGDFDDTDDDIDDDEVEYQCEAITRTGRRCRNPATDGDYCWIHA